MFANERQRKITEILRQNGAVTTKELMDIFHISIETVRRDLLTMEQQKLLQRVHGGAIAIGETKPFLDLTSRREENKQPKKELCVTAARFVSEGDTLGIDAGSTALFLANVLKERFSALTVITYSLDVFECLYHHKNFRIILCGGNYYPDENAFYGNLTEEMLEKLHMQKVFIFPYALSWQQGLCDHQEQLIPLQRCLLRQSDQVYILADSSKFEQKALHQIAKMDSSYLYITDGNLSPSLQALYTQNNIKIITGKEDAQ